MLPAAADRVHSMWRGESAGGPARLALLVGASLLAACAGGATPAQSGNGPSSTAAVAEVGADCPEFGGTPLQRAEVVELVELGESNGARVSGALYPRPDYEGNPWSQWGQGIVLDDGRHYSAIGDHRGVDGNSFVYEYDPATNSLAMVADVLSYVEHVPGTWGYGKIHSQMVEGSCGEVYFSTYWGTFRDIVFEGNYRGDILFRLDPQGATMEPLDVPVELHGQASLAGAPSFGLVYGEAVDPVRKGDGTDRGPFFVYDVMAEETVHVGPEAPHVGYRSVLVDANGNAFYSIGGGELARLDPVTGKETTHDARLPGQWLRAATEPGPEGHVYGVTREPDTFFVMNTDGSIDELGDALGYTASMALSPDGSAFYYMPGAHGNSSEWSSPLMMVDTESGEQTVVAELADLVMDGLGYLVGGTYNVTVSPDGNTVYLGVNASEPDGNGFGEVILLAVELP